MKLRLFSSAAVLAVAVLTPGLIHYTSQAAAQTNLLPNGGFDAGTTSGWGGTNASLAAVKPGFGGTAFAVKVTRTTGTSYSMFAKPRPVTTAVPQGEQFQGGGEVSGVKGRKICLLLREVTPGGSVVQTVQGCLTAVGGWQAIGPVGLTMKNAGNQVGYLVQQNAGVAGDSFLADSLTLTDVTASPSPTPTTPSPTPTTPSPTPPPSGLVAQWNMDEPAGATTMIDSSGNGNNGTFKNGVQAGLPGETGTAYLFSGQSYVDVPSSDSLNPGTASVDISFWLNTTHLPTSGDYDLVRKGVYPGQEYKTELLQSGQLACAFTGSTGTVTAIGGPGLADGAWHHVECVKTDTQVQLSIDGAVVATTSGSAGPISTSGDVTLGAHPGYDYYQGMLDDVTLTFG